MTLQPNYQALQIGAILFEQMDQCDFTGPFEVLSRIPGASFHTLAKEKAPVRDVHGLILTPEKTLAEAPELDLLVVPGGPGQELLMDDETLLSFLRERAMRARYVLSVCTGALLCGAAGLLRGLMATTHWTAFHLLAHFGAIPTDQRVVIDRNLISAAGVTAGFDGALVAVSLIAGEDVAKTIQLSIQYAPEPPFRSGDPAQASPEILETARRLASEVTRARLATAKRVSQRLGITTPRLA